MIGHMLLLTGNDAPGWFDQLLKSDPSLSTGLAAIRTLMKVLAECEAGTLQELVRILMAARDAMKTQVDCSSVSVASAGELFLRFITLASEALEGETRFEDAKRIMLRRGEQFYAKLSAARPKIVKLAEPFLKDGSRILVHSHSRCVVEALASATKAGVDLKVYATESCPDRSGVKTMESLKAFNVPCELVLDCSVASVLSRVDYVLMGAEGVVESGGVVNKIGSYTLAMCAKELNKPVYILCESFKFVRLYPLGQDDLPHEFKVNNKKTFNYF